MRRWIIAALVLAILTALFVWQWRVAAPLDIANPAVRGRIEFLGQPQGLVAWSSADEPPHQVVQPPPPVVIGQWEYTATYPHGIALFGPRDDDDLPFLEKRPVTIMARLRALLGAG